MPTTTRPGVNTDIDKVMMIFNKAIEVLSVVIAEQSTFELAPETLEEFVLR